MNKPLHTIREYGVSVTAWPTKNGDVSFTIQKSYKVKDTGEYKTTNTFFDRDIANLGKVCQQMLDWLGQQGDSAVEAHWEHLPSAPKPKEVAETAPSFDDDDIPF